MTDSNTAVTFLPDGNVCTPKGFRASGIHCGLRRNKTKKDLALIVSDVPAAAAAVYTLNAVKGAPIAVTKANIADGRAQAMLCNSGNANTCNADGIEIAEEWLYHIGVPLAEIHDMAVNSANTVPCMMPYVMSYFMPRALGDRPAVVPEGSVNLAFIGNFAETPRDTVFTTEYSVRTAMEAVYTLLGVDRGVPEVFASCYDVRMLMNSASRLMDGKKLADIKVPFIVRQLEKKAVEKSRGTIIHELLEQYGLI